jgi:hypothetical protein
MVEYMCKMSLDSIFHVEVKTDVDLGSLYL